MIAGLSSGQGQQQQHNGRVVPPSLPCLPWSRWREEEPTVPSLLPLSLFSAASPTGPAGVLSCPQDSGESNGGWWEAGRGEEKACLWAWRGMEGGFSLPLGTYNSPQRLLWCNSIQKGVQLGHCMPSGSTLGISWEISSDCPLAPQGYNSCLNNVEALKYFFKVCKYHLACEIWCHSNITHLQELMFVANSLVF